MITLNTIKNSYTPTFGLYLESVKDDSGNIIYRKDTALFRNDLDFDELVNYLDKKYKSTDKVNVIAHACSDGEECYSVVSVLDSILGEKAEKFYPIIAKDIDKNAIEKAKQGVFYITTNEYMGADYYLKENINKYFKPYPLHAKSKTILEHDKYSGMNYKAQDNVLNKIIFENGNILEDSKNINFKNTVLLARNFWPYLTKEEINTLVKTLAHRMDNSSTLVIGSYDKEYGIDKLLKQYGFIETEIENVFEIPQSKSIKNIYEYNDYKIY